jgi:hypothetical protein
MPVCEESFFSQTRSIFCGSCTLATAVRANAPKGGHNQAPLPRSPRGSCARCHASQTR